jgi:hypothetical protein
VALIAVLPGESLGILMCPKVCVCVDYFGK